MFPRSVFLAGVGIAERDMHGVGELLGGLEAGRPLVVEIDVRAQLLQDTAFCSFRQG